MRQYNAFGSVELEVLVDGQPIREYQHLGRTYVEGRRGSEYALRFSNNTGYRALAIITVDGLSVINGERGSYESPGYVVKARSMIRIPGWRLNDREVAQFFFGTMDGSYAAKMDMPNNVGVIGCAVFREILPPPHYSNAVFSGDNVKGPVMRGSGSSSQRFDFGGLSQNIGTGFGSRIGHSIIEVGFEKATDLPDWEIAVYYDDREGLRARGVDLGNKPQVYNPNPKPFPGGVGCKPPKDWRG